LRRHNCRGIAREEAVVGGDNKSNISPSELDGVRLDGAESGDCAEVGLNGGRASLEKVGEGINFFLAKVTDVVGGGFKDLTMVE